MLVGHVECFECAWKHEHLDLSDPTCISIFGVIKAFIKNQLSLYLISGIPGSDYINSNYIDGYRKQNAYIATQGSLPETFGEFWRMIWEQRSAIIVMMTKLEERSRVGHSDISQAGFQGSD